jgi:DNA-binding transcriptional LysR family regulator
MIDLNRLNTFLEAAETLNFSETAQRLHVSQPTVSKYIRDLERDLGVQLFDRNGAGLRLTDTGQSLLPWARKLIQQSNDFSGMVKSFQEDITGDLRIACTTAAGKYILPQLAARFRQRLPGVRISIPACTQEDAFERLLGEEADLGVLSVETAGNGLECQCFFTDHIILIVPAHHPWVARQFVEPADLLDAPLILREPTSGTRRTVLSELAAHDITLDDLNVLLEVGSAEAIVASVGAGIGVSFVSRMAAAYALAFECVVAVPVTGLDLRRRICMARRRLAVPSRAQEAFWSFVHDPGNADLLRLAEM